LQGLPVPDDDVLLEQAKALKVSLRHGLRRCQKDSQQRYRRWWI
jgi:hypothetical protein